MLDLGQATALLRLLSDPTRVRLLALLRREELTVAELSAVLGLAQPRVSTHLAKLKDAGLVRDRRAGVSAYYRFNDGDVDGAADVLRALEGGIDDAQIVADAQRLPSVLARRARERGWADTVAGDMERHYSPGRTWETLARTLLQLLETGDVLDIASGDGVLAELLAPHAHSIVCVDSSERVVAAARERLKAFRNVEVIEGDMHTLGDSFRPRNRHFDLVLMMHALTYSAHPAKAIAEAARVLKPGGRLLAATLAKHAHRAAVAPFDHRNFGFKREELIGYARKAGLQIVHCTSVSREARPPHFEVLSLLARNPI
ncbi:MAG: metalloregulator ArsR/SmtB family transcription factor [Rhodanobacteraceae bacterium]